jgi:two-component system, NtrC family, response regulator GlrR
MRHKRPRRRVRKPTKRAKPARQRRPRKPPKVTRTQRAAQTSAASEPISRLILLVEDDVAARSGYAEFLSDHGFRVVALESASLALKHAAQEAPDLVLTDIALPDLDGIGLTRALKGNPPTANVSVIGLTGHWSVKAGQAARTAGMVALLLKPVAPAHLLAEIKRALGQQ